MKIKNLYWLIWANLPLTKAIYIYVAFFSASKPTIINNSIFEKPSNLVFMILGTIAALCGVLVSRNVFAKIDKTKKLMQAFRMESSFANALEYLNCSFPIYNISLGLVETSAIFGIASFLQSGSLPVIYYLLFISIIGWILTKPTIEIINEYFKYN